MIKVLITETLTCVVETDTTNEAQAIAEAKLRYKKEEIILDDTNYLETNFTIHHD